MVPEIFPEAVILLGAGLVSFLLGVVQRAVGVAYDRWAGLAAVALGIVVAVLVYLAGFVETADVASAQGIARAIIAGITIAMAAYKLPDTIRATLQSPKQP